MKIRITLLIFSMTILQSCSPKIMMHLSSQKHKEIDKAIEIIVIRENETVPENTLFIGDLKVGDSGFTTDCGYSKIINDAKMTARKSGANFIHLIQVKKPTTFGSSCYRIKAKLYRNLSPEIIAKYVEKNKTKNASRLPPDSNYAKVYFYRPSGFGALIGYKIRLGETIIGRMRNGGKFEYKINKFGKQTFWSKTESKTSVVVDIKKGQEYFIQCGLKMGVAIGRPSMKLVENNIGISEYESLIEKKK